MVLQGDFEAIIFRCKNDDTLFNLLHPTTQHNALEKHEIKYDDNDHYTRWSCLAQIQPQ